MVVLRGAILDGPAGLAYATLASIYEYLIVLKTKELQLKADDTRMGNKVNSIMGRRAPKRVEITRGKP